MGRVSISAFIEFGSSDGNEILSVDSDISSTLEVPTGKVYGGVVGVLCVPSTATCMMVDPTLLSVDCIDFSELDASVLCSVSLAQHDMTYALCGWAQSRRGRVLTVVPNRALLYFTDCTKVLYLTLFTSIIQQ